MADGAMLIQVDHARAKFNETEGKMEQYGKDTRKNLQHKVDEFDKSVEDKAAKAKSGLSGWFK